MDQVRITLTGVKPVDDPLWSPEIDRFKESFDAYVQSLADAEQAARDNAARYTTEDLDILAGYARGSASAFATAQRTARISFRPFIGGMLADSIAASTPDVLDEDRCGATE